MFVLDSSVTMAWGFKDEATPFTHAVLRRLRHTKAAVPAIWPFEVANTLVVGERRGRLSLGQAARFLQTLRSLPIAVDDQTWPILVDPIMALARQESLSAYDASYLELALRRGLPLATQDTRLRGAAARLGVALVSPTP